MAENVISEAYIICAARAGFRIAGDKTAVEAVDAVLNRMATKEYKASNILTDSRHDALIDFITEKNDVMGRERHYGFRSSEQKERFIGAAEIFVATTVATAHPELRIEIINPQPIQ